MHTKMKKQTLFLLPAFALFSCTAHHMATADKAYDRMAYAQATCSYEKVMRNSGDRDAALRMADAYNRQNKLDKAADWYAFAERIAPLDADQSLQYGQVLTGLKKHDLAEVQFERVLAMRPDDEIASSHLKATMERSSFFVDSTLFTIDPVRLEGISGAFSPMIYKNGIVFAGERNIVVGASNPWNGLSFLDLYSTSRSANGTWSAPVALPGDVNGRFHEGPAVFSADGKTMYFTRSDYFKFRLNKDGSSVSHLKLFRAELLDDGTWGNIHQFAYNGETWSTGHAALSSDGSILYFISDRPGGKGGTDLYQCTRSSEGWNEPENLGATINTPGNEMFPTMHGDTLYFSSNGHPGVGGLDIFKTWKQDGEWTGAVNMNYPVNTTADDMGIDFQKDGRSGFLSSDRSGSDGIYSFTMNEPTLVTKGIAINDMTDEPISDVEVKMLDITNGETMSSLTGDDGRFEFALKPEREIRVQGSKENMFTESVDLDTKGQRTSKVYDVELRMRPIEIEKPMIVNNIYYDYDKWDIRPEAAVELKKLARLFMDNSALSFELSSHTDSRASDMYNLVLSDARAKSAVDFLIRQGVDPQKITAKGYGETKLVNRCTDGVECTEEEHQQNRRTEFKVVKAEVVMQ